MSQWSSTRGRLSTTRTSGTWHQATRTRCPNQLINPLPASRLAEKRLSNFRRRLCTGLNPFVRSWPPFPSGQQPKHQLLDSAWGHEDMSAPTPPGGDLAVAAGPWKRALRQQTNKSGWDVTPIVKKKKRQASNQASTS